MDLFKYFKWEGKCDRLLVTPQQKPKVGKYAVINDTANAIRHSLKEFPNLKESTICGWRSVYLLELNCRTKQGDWWIDYLKEK